MIEAMIGMRGGLGYVLRKCANSVNIQPSRAKWRLRMSSMLDDIADYIHESNLAEMSRHWFRSSGPSS